MNQPEWITDPILAGIDPVKLTFLQMMVSEGKNLSPKEMMPFLLNVTKRGKNDQISFSEEEMESIISVLQKNSSSEEITRMNKILSLYKKKKSTS